MPFYKCKEGYKLERDNLFYLFYVIDIVNKQLLLLYYY